MIVLCGNRRMFSVLEVHAICLFGQCFNLSVSMEVLYIFDILTWCERLLLFEGLTATLR